MDGKLLILLSEDEAIIQASTAEALEDGGFRILPAYTGEEAIKLLDQHGSEITGLITDVGLGDGPDGWAVARYARTLNHEMPVVFTTAEHAEDWSVMGVPNSVLVQKPYAEAQVVTAITTLLNTSG